VMRPVYEAQESEYRRHRDAAEAYKMALAQHKAAAKDADAGDTPEPPAEPPPLRHLTSRLG